MVVDAFRDGRLVPVLRRRSFLHLGTEVAKTGEVPRERSTAAVAAVRRLQEAADKAGADVTVALATAALRDATNGARVLAQLERELGTPITLVSGDEEARLCFIGQRAGVWVGADPVLGFDLGGGSLEAAVGTADSVLAVTSVALGTARIQGEFSTGDVLSAEERRAISDVAVARAEPIKAMVVGEPMAARRVIASGGTVRALAKLAMGIHRPPPASGASTSVNQVEVPAGQLAELADRLASLDLESRLALPGIQARRAPLLPIGAIVLSALVEHLGLSGLVVSEWGLREGAILDRLALTAAAD